jgi:nicotinate dehydrogenase subunit B
MSTLPQGLLDNPRLSGWIGFEPGGQAGGHVRLSTGKVELGQGILTALAQIAAEELDVAFARMHVVSGDTDATPAEGATVGSLSIEMSGSAIRLATAEIRALFLAHVARRLNCAPDDLTVEDGRFVAAGEPTAFDYWTVAAEVDLDRDATGAVPPKRPRDYRLVGKSAPRLDLPAKLYGAAFVHDELPAGVLHARVVRQPWRDAALQSFDADAVKRAAAGDVDVVRSGSFCAVLSASETMVDRALAAAQRAAQWAGGAKPGAAQDEARWLLALPAEDNVIAEAAPRGEAASRFEATYTKPYIAHASLAPSCALARFEGGRLDVWAHVQGTHPLRLVMARALDVEAERITLHHRQGAGCYGHNGADDAALDAAVIALKRPGRTIRVQWTREDELAAAPFGTAMVVKISADLDAAGRPVLWTTDIWSPPHSARPGSNGGVNLLAADALPNPPQRPSPRDVPMANGGGAARSAPLNYDIPQRIVHHLVAPASVRNSSMRGLGAFANVYATESAMDELAARAGQDPVAYRLAVTRDPRMRAVIETAAAMAGWPGEAAPGSGRAQGFAFARYKSRGGYCALVVAVSVDEMVTLDRVWCAVDGGLIINPDGATNQIEGGIVQAASWALKEQVRFADGRVATRAWADYPILRFSEVPQIDIRLVGSPDDPAFGLGEVSQGPTGAAIGNAVARALGTRIRDLPLTRERIAAALQA